MIFFLLIVLSFFSFFSSSAWATTRYVRTGCTNGISTYNPSTNTCTGGTALVYSTVANGLAALQSGDTLVIRAGTYNETLYIHENTYPNLPGTAENNRTWIGAYSPNGIRATNGNEKVTIQGPGNGNVTIQSDNGSMRYVTLDNLFLVGTGPMGTDASVLAINTQGGCPTCTGAMFIRAQNLDVSGAQRCGIGVFDASGGYNEYINVKSHDNGHEDCPGGYVGFGSHGFYMASSFTTLDNVEAYNNWDIGIQLYSDKICPNDSILKNSSFHGNGLGHPVAERLGMDICGANHQVFNNIIYNQGKGALIGRQRGEPGGAVNGRFLNNTVYGSIQTGVEFVGYVNPTSWIIRNNISSSNGTNFTWTNATPTFDHNLCSVNGTGCDSNLTELATNTFVNPATPDFQLKDGSKAINGGASCPPPATDRAQVSRPQLSACDVGAYEKTTTGVIPTVSITTPTPPSFSTGSSTTILSGTSTNATTMTWSNDRGGSDTITAANNWSTTAPGIPLFPGFNVITVTATNTNGSVAATITGKYIPTFPGNALVGAWGFETGSGPTATDSSAAGNNGTLVGPPTWSVGGGKFGNALNFNGLDQFVNVLDSNSLHLTQGFTFSAWVFPQNSHADFRTIFAKNNEVQRLYGFIAGEGFCGNGAIMGLASFNGGNNPQLNMCSTSALVPNQWTHLAFSYDGASLSLYKNGVLLGTPVSYSAGIMDPGTLALQIGASRFGEYWDGKLDEMRVYNFGIPPTAGANTSPGTACGYADYTNTVKLNPALASVIGDMNCSVVAPSPPLVTKFPANATDLKIGASATGLKFGTSP